MFGRWKKKPEPTLEPEQDDEAPAAYAVKTQAEVGLMFARRLDDPDEDRETQHAHARRAIERCLAGLAPIEDDFYHGFAAHMTIRLCVASGELLAAKALYAGIRDPSIREEVLKDVPDLMTRPIA